MRQVDFAEPVPFKAHAWVFNPWRFGTCACGREDWLRYYPEQRAFACLQCWLNLPGKMRDHRYHGHENRERLEWLWAAVRRKFDS